MTGIASSLTAGYPSLSDHRLIEYRTVVLAALLHDIGKFLQRGDFGPLDVSGKHPQVSANFVNAFTAQFAQVTDPTLLRTLVQRHHESASFPPELRVQEINDRHTQSLAYLVSRADNFSSFERGEKADAPRDYKTARLASVFGRLSVLGEKTVSSVYYPARPLTAIPDLEAVVFGSTSAEQNKGDVTSLLKDFGQEFSLLKENLDWKDFDTVLAHLIALLQRFTWAMPSDTQEARPDVSLFQHLKTSAAIAACLYLYHISADRLSSEDIVNCKSPRFRLLSGDLSGIQSYIFDIASTGAGGVAKRLRARSFYVQLLAEAASNLLIRRLGLPLCNILMTSGGKFYILLPNTDEATGIVNEVQTFFDEWLLRNLNGELALNLASVEFADEGFRPGTDAHSGFGGVLYRLSEALRVRKQRRFISCLQRADGWSEGEFLLKTDFAGQSACVSCRKFPVKANGLCVQCERDLAVGSVLPKAQYVAFYEDNRGSLALPGQSAEIRQDANAIPGRPYLVTRLNNPDLSSLAHLPASFRYLASYTPHERPCETCVEAGRCAERGSPDGGPATFNCLANRADGLALLGVLKADVDRLGELFVFGLKRPRHENSYDTVSRLATLSQRLDLFFSGWVEHLTSTEYRDCYTVFSGGDDLLLVGPWNKVVSLAERIRGDFAAFTNHPAITLSAGITLVKPHFPIASSARYADEALERAKRGDAGGEGRNRLHLLEHTLPWDDLPFIWKQVGVLRGAGEQLRSSFLYGLLGYGEMWQKFSKQGDVSGLRFQPMLAYDIARNVNARQQPSVHAWASRLVEVVPGDEQRVKILDYLKLIAWLVILTRRGGN